MKQLIQFIKTGYQRFWESQQFRVSNNFDGLPLLPLFGLLCGVLAGGIIICFRLFLDFAAAHIIERLDYHQGYLPIKNAVIQFITAAISLLSGQSIGREGPSIHLGATGGSVLGRLLKMPNKQRAYFNWLWGFCGHCRGI